MGGYIYQWIDLIWLPIAWFAAHRPHRLLSLAFVVTCALTSRTQVELMESFGAYTGVLSILHTDLWSRALIVYSIVTAAFLILAHYSPRTDIAVFLGASIMIYVFAFTVSMGAMML